METWVYGAILALVGVLIVACALAEGEFNFVFAVAGVSSVSAGSLIFISRFKKWVESL